MLDFAKVVSSDLKELEPKSRKLIPNGTYEAVLANVEFPKYRTATSEGIRFSYRIVSGEFTDELIIEDVIYKSEKGELAFNYARIKARLMAFGLTSDQINKFKWPKDNKGFGDFKNVLEAEVSVTVKVTEGTGILAGKQLSKPQFVAPRGTEPKEWLNTATK